MSNTMVPSERLFVCRIVIQGAISHKHMRSILMTGEKLDVKVNIPLRKDDIQKLYNYEFCSDAEYKKNLSDVIGPRYEAQQNKAIEGIIESAIKNSGYSEGDTISQAHIDKISKEVSENFLRQFVLRGKGRK